MHVFIRTVAEIIQNLYANVTLIISEVVVRKSNVLTDALRRLDRKTFDPRNMLNVQTFQLVIFF